jgi:hypothetical protein
MICIPYLMIFIRIVSGHLVVEEREALIEKNQITIRASNFSGFSKIVDKILKYLENSIKINSENFGSMDR